jgi:hypothetical protein
LKEETASLSILVIHMCPKRLSQRAHCFLGSLVRCSIGQLSSAWGLDFTLLEDLHQQDWTRADAPSREEEIEEAVQHMIARALPPAESTALAMLPSLKMGSQLVSSCLLPLPSHCLRPFHSIWDQNTCQLPYPGVWLFDSTLGFPGKGPKPFGGSMWCSEFAGEPKIRFRAARHQMSKTEQPDLILRADERLWPYSGPTLKLRLTKILSRLGLRN